MKIKARVVGRTKFDPDQQVTLDHVRVSGQDYSFQSLRKFCGIASRLQQCRFNNARIRDASFGSGREMSEYVECTFDGVHFDHGGGNARFVRCSFFDVYFREWLGQSTELIDCTFSGHINWAVFCGKIPSEDKRRDLHRDRNEFHGNDFSRANLVNVDFAWGIDLTQQRLPCGPEYLYVADSATAVARLKSGLEKWDASREARREASITANIFEDIVRQGQRQFFLRPESYYRMPEDTLQREALDKVFALLRNESRSTPD